MVSSLIKSSGIYTIASLLNASIPFLLIPLLTKYLSPADFGLVIMFSTITTIMTPFVGLSMEGVIARKYYCEKNNIPIYLGNCIIMSISFSLLVFLFCFIFKDVIFAYTSVPPEWILLCVLYCFSQFIVSLRLTLYQVKVRPLNYGLIQISQSILNFVSSVILITAFALKWEGRLIAQIFSSVLVASIAISSLLIKKEAVFKLDYSFISYALKFGGGLIPHVLGAAFIVQTNRFFILHMVDINETGLYGLASQVGSIISFFTVSFNNAYVPWLYKKLNQNDIVIKRKIVKLTYAYFLLIIIFGFLFYMLVPTFFKIFIDKNYVASLKYIFWVIFGFVFQGMYYMVTNYIIYSEKTYYQAVVTFVVGLFSIPANYFLITFVGFTGAAIAFCCSYFLLFIFTWMLSNRVYKMPWGLRVALEK